MARYYALAERPFIEADGESYWGLPNGTIGSVDLAPVQGHSYVFVTSDKPFNAEDVAVQLGDGTRLEEYHAKGTDRSAWQSLLGVTWQAGWTLLDALWAVLTVDSDPDGELRAKPIMPTHKGVLELHLGGHSLIRAVRMPKDPRQAPHWSAMQRVLQNDYARIKEHAQRTHRGKGEPNLHRKYLGAQQRKYRMTPEGARDLIGNGRDLPERPTTTITDDFNRADDATGLGTSAEGWSWAVVAGSWSITSNAAVSVGSNSVARAESDLSSDDHSTQCDVGNFASSRFPGVLTRFDGSVADTYYYFRRNNNDKLLELYKRIGGAFTLLGSIGNTDGPPITLKLASDGSSHNGYIGGASVLVETDTAVSGALRTGLRDNSDGTIIDNFEAADLLAGPTFNPAWARNSNVIIQAGR